MPLEVQTGDAVVYGIRDDGSGIAINGVATMILESDKIAHNFELDTIKGHNNFTRTLIAADEHIEKTIIFTPSGPTRKDGDAIVDGAFELEGKGINMRALSKVALSGFAYSWINDDWVYVGGGSIDLVHKDAKMQMKIRKYLDPEQNAKLTTQITA